jgi:hypothetical protein
MDEPTYRRHWHRIVYLLAGFATLGELLHAISGAREFITPKVTWIGTLIIAIALLAIQVLLPRVKPLWAYSEQRFARVSGIGIKPVWYILGILVLLWVPRIADYVDSPKETEVRDREELAAQWEELTHEPITYISIRVSFRNGAVRIKDLKALLTGVTLHFDAYDKAQTILPAGFAVQGTAGGDPQKTVKLVVMNDAEISDPLPTHVQFSKRFEGADEWLCWWSSRFDLKGEDDFSCAVDVSAELRPKVNLSLSTLFSLAKIQVNLPVGFSLTYEGGKGPPPMLEITINTKHRQFTLPWEEFATATEINDNTGAKVIVNSMSGPELRRTMREQFEKAAGLSKAKTHDADQELHTMSGRIADLMTFFPRPPTQQEWERMRKLHPELVPPNH